METVHEFLKKEWLQSDLRIEKEELLKEDYVTVLFGDFNFLEGTMGEPSLAIINRIDKETTCRVKDLDIFCENGLENYESYLIPALYKGEIRESCYENERSIPANGRCLYSVAEIKDKCRLINSIEPARVFSEGKNNTSH